MSVRADTRDDDDEVIYYIIDERVGNGALVDYLPLLFLLLVLLLLQALLTVNERDGIAHCDKHRTPNRKSECGYGDGWCKILRRQ